MIKKARPRITSFALILAGAAFVLPPALASAAQVWEETFTYPNGSLTAGSGGLWVAHSSGGAQPLQVNNGTAVVQQTGASAEDLNRAFAARPAGSKTYASFDVTVTATALTAPAYVAHFSDGGTSAFRSRVFVSPPTTSGFRLALSVNSSTAAVTWGSDLTLGQTYHVVHSFDDATGTAQLWVDPVNESSPSISTTDALTIGSTISAYCLRQAGNSTTHKTVEVVDNLGIGDSFPAAVLSVPSLSQWGLVLLGMLLAGTGGLLVARRRRQAVA